MVEIWTGRIGCGDPDAIDVTVKGGSVFGPTWDMVMGWKSGRLSWRSEYERQYMQLMRERYRLNRRPFEEVLKRDRVVLCCYCGTPEHCHRRLLAEILVKLGGTYRGELC